MDVSSDPLTAASDAEFAADWHGGLRSDCRDTFGHIVTRARRYGLDPANPALKRALREACRIAYRARYTSGVLNTHLKFGATVDLPALEGKPSAETDNVVRLDDHRPPDRQQ
jgi:hypothetical protein